MTDPGRFASCIDRDPVYGCWLWTRGLDRDGYGISYNGGGPRQAHREVYRELVGEPPAGKLLDHLCRRRNCVRPDHLEPVTERENQLRRTWASRVRKATCRNGHSLADCITTAEGGRLCRTCQGPEFDDDERDDAPLWRTVGDAFDPTVGDSSDPGDEDAR